MKCKINVSQMTTTDSSVTVRYRPAHQRRYLWPETQTHFNPALNDYPKWPGSVLRPDAMSHCGCWQRFRVLPWYGARWHGRPIRKSASHPFKVCPNMWLQVFSCSNCEDSDLIIIKSTCMTGRGPCNGVAFLIQSVNWGMVERVVALGWVGGGLCACVFCWFAQTFG